MNRVGTLPSEAILFKGPRLRAAWGRMLYRLYDRETDRMAQRLRESEEWKNLAAEAAHLAMWTWDMRADSIRLSDQCRELFGFKNGHVTYQTFLNRIHPEDRAAADKAMQGALWDDLAYHLEYRLLLPDGTVRHVQASGQAHRDKFREPLRILGICIDISGRRQAEESARELSGRFITAQEDERRRIARDLHDDLNQRLALLSVEMELLSRDLPDQEYQRAWRLEQVAARIKELSSEVHKLSYQLHPAKLDQLGLVAAGRSFCRELSQQSGVRIDFLPAGVPRYVPTDIALCLYRVIQESLRNVVRHSGASECKVHLQMVESRLHLLIADSGKGFNLEVARRTGGLGLISMEERIRLVHGSVAIRSRPGCGTQITVDVPLPKTAQPSCHA